MTWDNPGYGTHLEALVWALHQTTGTVLEIGAGEWSTPFLHQVCHRRGVVTIENNPDWANRFVTMHSEWHSWYTQMTPELEKRHWGVVLIDNDPEDARGQWLELDTDYFVVHDSQIEGGGSFRANREAIRSKLLSFPSFREYTDLWPNTAVVSRRKFVPVNTR